MGFEPDIRMGAHAESSAQQVKASLENPFKPLSDDELRSVVSSELSDSVGGGLQSGSQISEKRRNAMRLFLGKPFGNEVAGRSRVVTTDVSDTIHWMMPSLMKMLFGGRRVWEFESLTKEGQEQAEQATEVINQQWNEECSGFETGYEWIFSGLLEMRSYVKVEQEELVEPKITPYRGLTHREFEALMNERPGALEVIEYDEREIRYEDQVVPVIDCRVQELAVTSKMVVRGIPSEQFVVGRREKKINDRTFFCGERRKLSSSDLIAMGFNAKKVAELPIDDSMEFSQERQERLWDEDDFPESTNVRSDLASRMHWVNDCFIRVDADGDGYSELRNVMVIGDQATVLLDNQYASHVPYASIAPIPIPYKLHGLSIADLVGDLQKIKSTLMRQILDNTYLQTNQRHVVVEGAVQVSDLLTSRPGGIIRANSPDAVKPLDVTPLSPIVMQLIDYVDHEREIRTGVSAERQGMDASVLKSSATGVSASLAAAQARVELIARVIAETGLKDLGHLLYRTFKTNNNKAMTMCIRGKWVDVDPSQWHDRVKVKVNVGLGVGAAAERISFLMGMIQLMKEAIGMGASFMVSPRHVYEAVSRLSEAMGYRENLFFDDPGDQQWPPPPPNAEMIEAEAKRDAEKRLQVEAQLKHEIEKLKTQAEMVNNEGMLAWRKDQLASDDKLNQRDNDTKVLIAQINARKQESNAGADA